MIFYLIRNHSFDWFICLGKPWLPFPRPGRHYSSKSCSNDATQITGISVSLAFTLLSPSFLSLLLSPYALMSQAHCAERSGSDVSVLLVLKRERQGPTMTKLPFFLFAHFSSISPSTIHYLKHDYSLTEEGSRGKKKKTYSV